jgi:hypothetical protein
MLLTNHALTGLFLSQGIQNPLVLAPTALASHLALDALPHFGWKGASFKDKRWLTLATFDCLAGLTIYGLALIARPQYALNITVGIFFATLPDLLFLSAIFLNRPIKNAFTRFHSWIQWSESPMGGLLELGWMLGLGAALVANGVLLAG